MTTNLKDGQFTVIAATVLLAGCPGPVIRNVGQTDIAGHVTDRDTGIPISGACLVASLAKGGFWTTQDQSSGPNEKPAASRQSIIGLRSARIKLAIQPTTSNAKAKW